MTNTARRYRMGAGALAPERVAPLFRSVFGEAFAERARRTWAWKYEQSPQALARGPRLFYTEHDDAIVAFHGAMQTTLRLGDRRLPAVWGCDYAVDAGHRGRGIALLKYFMTEQRDILQLGTPVGRAYQFEKRMGCSDVCAMTNFKSLLRPLRVLRAKGRSPVGAVPAAAAYRLAAAAAALARRRAGGGGVTEVAAFDDRFDDLWRRVAPDYDAIGVRDRAFLQWRFADCPHRCYITGAAEREGRLEGYIVYRLDDIDGLRYGRVVDVLAARDDAVTLDRLLAWALAGIRAEGADLATLSIACCPAAWRRPLRARGFLIRSPGLPVIVGKSCAGRERILAARDPFFTRADSDADLA